MDHAHWIVVEQCLDVHVILIHVHEPGSYALVSILQVLKVPEHPFELSDAIVHELILGGLVVVDEPLQKLFVAQHHVHKRLIQVLVVQLPPIEVEV